MPCDVRTVAMMTTVSQNPMRATYQRISMAAITKLPAPPILFDKITERNPIIVVPNHVRIHAPDMVIWKLTASFPFGSTSGYLSRVLIQTTRGAAIFPNGMMPAMADKWHHIAAVRPLASAIAGAWLTSLFMRPSLHRPRPNSVHRLPPGHAGHRRGSLNNSGSRIP